MSKEYTIMMGLEQKNYFDALIKHQMNPTKETKKEVDRLSNESTQRMIKWQSEKEVGFIETWGQDLFDFVKSISKEYFLVGKTHPYSLSWDVKADYEIDDYWAVRFWKGKFDYVLSECGGYAGTKVLEENISRERVLELISHSSETKKE